MKKFVASGFSALLLLNVMEYCGFFSWKEIDALADDIDLNRRSQIPANHPENKMVGQALLNYVQTFINKPFIRAVSSFILDAVAQSFSFVNDDASGKNMTRRGEVFFILPDIVSYIRLPPEYFGVNVGERA